MSRSRSTTARMPGRCTFTTASVPSVRRARYTCAIDALARGVGIELREHLVRRSEFVAQDLLNLVVRRGRDLVLQLAQLGDELGREQIRPGGQHLTEFDKRDSGFFQRFPQRTGQLGSPDRVGCPEPASQRGAEPVPQRDPRDSRIAPGACDPAGNLAQPADEPHTGATRLDHFKDEQDRDRDQQRAAEDRDDEQQDDLLAVLRRRGQLPSDQARGTPRHHRREQRPDRADPDAEHFPRARDKHPGREEEQDHAGDREQQVPHDPAPNQTKPEVAGLP
jgi:hypothetical protein